MFLTQGRFGCHLLEMSEELAEVAAPIKPHKVHAQNVVATVRARMLTLTPLINAGRTDNAQATGKHGRIFRKIKAE
jgi:hypothetical protein